MKTAKTCDVATINLVKEALKSITRFIVSNQYLPDTLILNFCEGYPAFGVVFQKPNEPAYKFYSFFEPVSYIEDQDTEKKFIDAVSSIQGPATYVASSSHKNSFYRWNLN